MGTFFLAILWFLGALNKKKERIRAEKEVQEKEKLRQSELDERIENHRDLFLQTKAYYQQGES